MQTLDELSAHLDLAVKKFNELQWVNKLFNKLWRHTAHMFFYETSNDRVCRWYPHRHEECDSSPLRRQTQNSSIHCLASARRSHMSRRNARFASLLSPMIPLGHISYGKVHQILICQRFYLWKSNPHCFDTLISDRASNVQWNSRLALWTLDSRRSLADSLPLAIIGAEIKLLVEKKRVLLARTMFVDWILCLTEWLNMCYTAEDTC